jgi:hypothetical protein
MELPPPEPDDVFSATAAPPPGLLKTSSIIPPPPPGAPRGPGDDNCDDGMATVRAGGIVPFLSHYIECSLIVPRAARRDAREAVE